MKVLAKLFWRILLPLLLALILTAIEIFGRPGGRGPIPSHHWEDYILICLFALLAIASFVNAFRNTLQWGKEAEEFESHLQEAGEFEKERRRRANWIRW